MPKLIEKSQKDSKGQNYLLLRAILLRKIIFRCNNLWKKM